MQFWYFRMGPMDCKRLNIARKQMAVIQGACPRNIDGRGKDHEHGDEPHREHDERSKSPFRQDVCGYECHACQWQQYVHRHRTGQLQSQGHEFANSKFAGDGDLRKGVRKGSVLVFGYSIFVLPATANDSHKPGCPDAAVARSTLLFASFRLAIAAPASPSQDRRWAVSLTRPPSIAGACKGVLIM